MSYTNKTYFVHLRDDGDSRPRRRRRRAGAGACAARPAPMTGESDARLRAPPACPTTRPCPASPCPPSARARARHLLNFCHRTTVQHHPEDDDIVNVLAPLISAASTFNTPDAAPLLVSCTALTGKPNQRPRAHARHPRRAIASGRWAPPCSRPARSRRTLRARAAPHGHAQSCAR